MSYSIELGDVVSVLRFFNDNSFDALACDPPYGFRFMGKAWDMIGAVKAGWPHVFGIEHEAEYVTIARVRLAHWCKESEAV